MEVRKELIYTVVLLVFTACMQKQQSHEIIKNDLRAPAYPLLTVHPDFSIWAVHDTLSAQFPRFFEKQRDFPFVGAIRVDGIVYRFMGRKELPLKAIAPISFEEGWSGKYTFVQPEEGWQELHFNDSLWKTGEAAFGTGDIRSVKTLWPASNIWVRREINIDKETINKNKLYLRYSHDDVFQLYINGKQLVSTGFIWRGDVKTEIPDSILQTITEDNVIIAAHCENRVGRGLVDFGIYAEPKEQSYMDSVVIQKSVDVQATQTHYTFQCDNIELKLSFTAPLLMDNLELLSRPVNYISYRISSLDGKKHQAEIYFEMAPRKILGADEITINRKENMLLARMGNSSQKLWSNPNGIDPAWGYLYVGTDEKETTYAIGDASFIRQEFTQKGAISLADTTNNSAYFAITQSLDTSEKTEGKVLIGFDGLYTIEYFGENLLPYWNRKGNRSMDEEMVQAHKEADKVISQTYEFDHQLMVQALLAGGKEYAELCALAYRQTIAPFQLSETPDGDLLFFTKSVGPVDVYYPSAPLFLLYNPLLVEAMLNPFFYYSESMKWSKPYPAHDLGGYPVVNGQTYADDMPIEEAGNMLILTAAIIKLKNDASYAEKHWKTLSQWAGYLLKNGLDTNNQISSDLFNGIYPHNANLAVKSILGLASYSYIASTLGHTAIAQAYKEIVKKRVIEWEKKTNGGTHYKLTSEQRSDSTWSQKYNLIWDQVLELNAYTDSIRKKETTFYLTKLNKYGLPLDNNHDYTKIDWSAWIATMTQDRQSFRKLMNPIHRFMNETPDRVPMSDFILTKENTRKGFMARPVVGAFYIKMMLDNK